LANAAEFIQHDFITTDTASHHLKALQLFRQLMQLHKPDADPAAFIDVNLERIQWAYRKTHVGSFSGKFLIPQNVLTGEFSIETLDFDGDIEFNVEEYKRPTYYVEFDTLKGSYRLNDTITITGYVKSYTGSVIDNASVNYTVQRTANFPYPYLSWKTSSSAYT
jgi:hypothetical protein